MNNQSFSLITGGPIYRFLGRFGSTHLSRHVITASALAWLPLLILTLVYDLISKQDALHTFLRDPVHYARYLLAIPIYLGMTPVLDRWASAALQHLTTCRIVSDSNIGQMNSLIGRLLRMRDSLIPELIMLGLSFTNSFVRMHIEKMGVSIPWLMVQGSSSSSLTMAGWWNHLFSLPLFGFLTLIWIWRFVIWSYFLVRVSRYRLQLMATHPDLAGGIAFLSIPQRTFGGINLAIGIVIAAAIAQHIIFRGASALDYKAAVIAYTLVAPAVVLAPLLAFAPDLIRTRYTGFIKYSALADEYTEAFDNKWVAKNVPDGDELLGTSDIQSLADLANSFSVIRNMNVFPFVLRDYLILAVVSLVPFIPLILTVIPAKELILKLTGLLFG